MKAKITVDVNIECLQEQVEFWKSQGSEWSKGVSKGLEDGIEALKRVQKAIEFERRLKECE